MGSRSSAETRLARGRDLAIAGTALGCLGAAFVAPESAVEDGLVVCPFRLATGRPCPGCGLARSWVALGHGDLGTALDRHPFGPGLFAAALVAVAAAALSALRRAAPVDLARRAGSRAALAVAAAWCGVWLVGLIG